MTTRNNPSADPSQKTASKPGIDNPSQKDSQGEERYPEYDHS